MWYLVNSYIVRQDDVETFHQWAVEQDFMGRRMPESHEQTGMFLGEFFWSPAYKYHSRPYFGYEGWTRGGSGEIPVEILVTTEMYMQEDANQDSSMDDTVLLHLPCKWIHTGMGLRWCPEDYAYRDDAGERVCFDPSVAISGPSGLIVHRGKFLDFLAREKCAVVWTVLAGKSWIPAGIGSRQWKGRLGVSGAYRLRGSALEGKTTPRFECMRKEDGAGNPSSGC